MLTNRSEDANNTKARGPHIVIRQRHTARAVDRMAGATLCPSIAAGLVFAGVFSLWTDASAQQCTVSTPAGYCTIPECGAVNYTDGEWVEGVVDYTAFEGEPTRPKFGRSLGWGTGHAVGSFVEYNDFPDDRVPETNPDLAYSYEIVGEYGGVSYWNDAVDAIPEGAFDDGYASAPPVEGPISAMMREIVPLPQGEYDRLLAAAEATDGTAGGSDPVNPANGEFVHRHVDLEFPGFGVPFVLERIYRSRVDFDGPLGYGWDHSLNRRLVVTDSGDCAGVVSYMPGDATALRFEQAAWLETPIGTNVFEVDVSYVSPPGVHATLSATGTRMIVNFPPTFPSIVVLTWTLTEPSGIVQHFDDRGLGVRIEDQNHHGLSIEWEDSPREDQYRVAAVTDSVGRVITFSYDSSNGRLASVFEPTSALGASYGVAPATSDLDFAVDQSGRAEHYEYDYDPARTTAAGEYVPERALRPACEALCSPEGSTCRSAGVCDDAAVQGLNDCTATCTGCEESCGPACTHDCEVAYWLPCAEYCDEECSPTVVRNICQTVWDEVGEDRCAACGVACGEAAGWSCNALIGCAASLSATGLCLLYPGAAQDIFNEILIGLNALQDAYQCGAYLVCDFFTLGLYDCPQDCNFFETQDMIFVYCHNYAAQCCVSGDECAPDSCQSTYDCHSECRVGFWGDDSPEAAVLGFAADCSHSSSFGEPNGCLARAKDECDSACTGECVLKKEPECAAACSVGCATGCNESACEDFCLGIDYARECHDGCVAGCIDHGHQAVGDYASGPKYGYYADRNHNIIRILDGNLNAYLELSYGEDIYSPSFDAVIAQSVGGRPVTLGYRDLTAEARGDLAPPSAGVAASKIVAKETFETVDICPAPCWHNDETGVATDVVPWTYGLIHARSVSGRIGGYSARASGAAGLPPTLLVISKDAAGAVTASSITGGEGIPTTLASFSAIVSGRSVTFSKTNSPGVFTVAGDKIALGELLSTAELTIVTDIGGAFRVYPGRPVSLVHLSSGTCWRPFVAARNAAGQTQITPVGACSDDLVISPMATGIEDPTLLAAYRDAGSAAFAGLDLFAATSLLPGRHAVVLRAIPGISGRYETSVGPAGGAAPASLSKYIFESRNTAPLLRAPDPAMLGTRPLYAYHLPLGQRPAGSEGVPVWDSGAKFDPSLIDPSCFSGTPDVPRRGAGTAAPGPKPDWATVVTDPYGVAWSFYYDARGRSLRSVNDGTGAVRSYNYNERGELLAVERPLLDRQCLTWDDLGNLISVVTFPVPGAIGPTLPMRQRFDYSKDIPSRLGTVYDPRDPVVALRTLAWDTAGNLLSTTDPSGEVTTFTPSEWGLPEEVARPGGAVDTYSYNAGAGTLQSHVVDATGGSPVVQEVWHDAAGRPEHAVSPLGETTTWAYAGGLPDTVLKDADGLIEQVQLTYDGDGQLVGIDDALTSSLLTYDAMGSPQTVTLHAADGSASDQVWCALLGTDGRALEAVDPEGNRVLNTYDGEGRLTRVERGLWPASAEPWDDPCAVASGSLTTLTAAAYEYDRNGRAVEMRNALGAPTSVEYDGFGRPAIVRDARGVSHRYGYDAMGNIVWSAVYAADGTGVPYQPPSLGDAGLVAATEWVYDGSGRLIREDRWHFVDGMWRGDGRATTEYEYSAGGRSIKITDDGGHETTVTQDGAGRLVFASYPTTDTVTQQFLDGGRTVRQSRSAPTADGVVSETVRLNAWGAPVRLESDETGVVTVLEEWQYDASRRLALSSKVGGATRGYAYDALGRPTTITSTTGATTETVALQWDRNGRLRSSSSNAGDGAKTWIFDYDAMNRLVRSTWPTGVHEEYGYLGASGLLSWRRDPLGVEFSYSHDVVGNLTGLTAISATGHIEGRVYAYSALDLLQEAVDRGADYLSAADDVSTYFAWDSLGEKTAEWNSLVGVELGITHSVNGLGQKVNSELGDVTVTRTFDGLDRLTSLSIGGDITPEVSFVYDGFGGPVSRSYGSGVASTFDYDAYGRLVGIVDDLAGTRLAAWRWEIPLDGVPRVAGLKKGADAELSSIYSVDGGGRVLSENHSLADVVVDLAADAAASVGEAAIADSRYLGTLWRGYTLDGRHNWLTRSGGVTSLNTSPKRNALDAYTSFSGVSAYYDSRGDLLNHASSAYEYNNFGELIHASTGSAGREYRYDALGRVVQEIDGATGIATSFGHDGYARVVTKDAAGFAAVMIDGDGLDEHLLEVDSSGNLRYFHQDRNRSVYLVTGETGSPLEWYSYTAYGDMTIQSPGGATLAISAIGNRFGFQGQRFDASLGLLEMRNRFYRPEWGRFLNPDPIGLRGGSNLYAFVGGAPLSFWDPLGLGKTRVDYQGWFNWDGSPRVNFDEYLNNKEIIEQIYSDSGSGNVRAKAAFRYMQDIFWQVGHNSGWRAIKAQAMANSGWDAYIANIARFGPGGSALAEAFYDGLRVRLGELGPGLDAAGAALMLIPATRGMRVKPGPVGSGGVEAPRAAPTELAVPSPSLTTVEGGRGPVVGLGLDRDLYKLKGAITYENGGWQRADLTKVDWGRASVSNTWFRQSFQQAVSKAGAIVFEVSSLEMGYSPPGLTMYELSYIVQRAELLAKTTFVRNGKPVVWDGFGFVEP